MKYLPVFDIRLRHAFYADGRCADFTIEPSAAGQRVLANHRLIAKPRPDGVEVFTPVGSGDQPFIPFRQDMALEFYLYLDNRDFALFSDLDALGGIRAPVYANPASSPEPGGELAIQADDAPLPLPARASVFARIRITGIQASWLDAGPVQYTITFQPVQARWVYYFVTARSNGGTTGASSQLPRIVDGDPARADAPLQFTTSDLGDGVASGDIVEDRVALNLAGQYPDHQRFRIVSADRLACRQEARKRLALYLGDQKLSSALANPSIHDFSALGIQVDETLEQQKTLFRVIEH